MQDVAKILELTLSDMTVLGCAFLLQF